MGLLTRRIPREEKYFDLFERLAKHLTEAAAIFCSSDITSDKKAHQIKELEREADTIVHEVHDLLDIHRDPPLQDLEDIQQLVHDIDEVLDLLEKAAHRIYVYKLDYEPSFLKLGGMAKKASQQIVAGVCALRDFSKHMKNHTDIKQCFREIYEIEREGDQFHRQFIAQLVDEIYCQNMQAMFRKEIGQILEDALDAAECVANSFESLKNKNA